MRRSSAPPPVASPVTVLMPGAAAGEWTLLRRPAGAPESVTRQTFATLEAAAVNLLPEEEFHLDLPLDYGLVQRFALPAAEPDELEEMVRIQLEKILPYPIEEVGIALQTIHRTEAGVIVSAQAVHYDRLLGLCQPLTNHGRWPLRVSLHAVAIATGAAAGENSAFLYRAAGKVVLGVCEEGRMSYAQTLGSHTAEDLAGELPTVFLGAELEGVPTAFQFVRLDERCADWLPVIQAAVDVPVELFRAEPAPTMAAPPGGPVEKDLSPASWQLERERVLRRARGSSATCCWGSGFTWACCCWRLPSWVCSSSRSTGSTLSCATPRRWSRGSRPPTRAGSPLAPAIDPTRSVAGTFEQVFECLPPGDTVRLTLFDQKLDTVEIRGEATNQAALDFTEQIKARPELRGYNFQASPPVILPSGKAQFNIVGTHK